MTILDEMTVWRVVAECLFNKGRGYTIAEIAEEIEITFETANSVVQPLIEAGGFEIITDDDEYLRRLGEVGFDDGYIDYVYDTNQEPREMETVIKFINRDFDRVMPAVRLHGVKGEVDEREIVPGIWLKTFTPADDNEASLLKLAA